MKITKIDFKAWASCLFVIEVVGLSIASILICGGPREVLALFVGGLICTVIPAAVYAAIISAVARLFAYRERSCLWSVCVAVPLIAVICVVSYPTALVLDDPFLVISGSASLVAGVLGVLPPALIYEKDRHNQASHAIGAAVAPLHER